MSSPRFESFALQSLNNPSSTTLNTLASAAPSTRPLQPHVHDVEADTFSPAQSRSSRFAAFLKSDKAVRLGAYSALGAFLIGGGVFSIVDIVKKSSASAHAKSQAQYCAQFANFSWVAPNFAGANITATFDIGPESLLGNFINFHNQPANMTGACMNLFGTQQVVHNPNPTNIAALNVFGPFPGTTVWNYVDGASPTDAAAPTGVQLLKFHFVSDYNEND